MDSTKSFFAFIAVGSAGLLLLVFSRIEPPRSGHYGMMLNRHQLQSYARDHCIKAALPKTGISLNNPTEILGEGIIVVQLNWRPGPDSPYHVACRYEQARGVTELKIDGKSYGPVNVDMGENPSTRPPGSMVEKHWGHW